MTSLIDKALSCVGLMRVAEHERFVKTAGKALANSEADLKKAEDTARQMLNDRNRIAADHGALENDMTAKFKKAVTDLEGQASEIAGMRAELTCVKAANEAFINENAKLEKEVRSLRPDALLWRNARDKRAGKRGKANG